jgi:hypothetical protein
MATTFTPMQIERALLKFLATEEFCSEYEIEEFVRLQGGTADQAAALVGEWRARGWLESFSEGESNVPTLLSLTDRAYEANTWLAQAI